MWTAKRAPLWKKVIALEVEVGGRKKGSFVSIIAIPAFLLLQEADTEKVCQTVRASDAVHTCAASEVRVQESFLWRFWEKSCRRLF